MINSGIWHVIPDRFDTELQMLQDELRQERLAKERAHRDRDAIQSEKLTLEQTLQVMNCLNLTSQ